MHGAKETGSMSSALQPPHSDRDWPHNMRSHLIHYQDDLSDPASQEALLEALMLHKFLHPSSEFLAAMEDIGRQSGAVGLDLEGNSVARDADGKLHTLETAEQLKTQIRPYPRHC